MLAQVSRRAVAAGLVSTGMLLAGNCPLVTPAMAQQSAPAKVRIGIYGILPEAGLFIAQERGYFAAESLAVELVANAAGPEALPALTSGELDAVGGAITPGVINATRRGLPIKMVTSTSSWEAHGNSSFFLIRKELAATIKDWKELRGKKIAISPAQPNLNGFIVARALALGGLTLKDVQTVEVPLPSMIVALKTGGVDGAHTSEPFSTLATQSGVAVKWQPASAYLPGLNPSMLSYGPSLLSKRPEVGERFMVAYLRGARDYVKAMATGEGKSEIIAILVKNTSVKDRTLYDRMGMSHIDPDGVIVIQKTDAASLIDDRFRQAALKRLGAHKK
jgi:NitT/TauT family transport system substrate-binding protein